MNKKKSISGNYRILFAIFLALIILPIFCFMTKHIFSNNLTFQSNEINANIGKLTDYLNDPQNGIVLRPPSGHATSLIGYVGMILVGDFDEKPFVMIGDQRPSRSNIIVQPLEENIYEGIVTTGFNQEVDGNILNGKLQTDEAAELIIQNDLVIAYKDNKFIPWNELRKLKLIEGKSYWFVDSVVLTSVTYRKYIKIKGKKQISGTAFGIKGEIYASSEGFNTERLLSLRVFNLRHSKMTEGASSSLKDVRNLFQSQEIGTHNANRALKVLHSESYNSAKNIFKTEKLPQYPLIEYESNINTKSDFKLRVKGVTSICQSAKRDCWATAATILFSWKKKSGYDSGRIPFKVR